MSKIQKEEARCSPKFLDVLRDDALSHRLSAVHACLVLVGKDGGGSIPCFLLQRFSR